MQTRSLTTLVEIDRCGSFKGAAERLNMTLSAVSMQMKSLERELGADLFDRTFRPPQLTPLGRAVGRRARQLLREQTALHDLCRPAEGLTGDILIGFVATASVRLMPGFLKRARARAPDLRIAIATGLSDRLESQVLAGRFDAAVVTGSSRPPAGLTYRLLRREPLIYAMPRDAAAIDPGRLAARLPFLQFMPQSGIGKVISGHVAGTRSRPAETLVFDSVEAILECVRNGIGFTLLPEPDIRRYADDGIVTRAPDRPITRQLVLATAAGGHMDRRAGALLDLFE